MSLVRFRVRAPLFKEPSLWLGFCISAAGLSIELRSIIRRQRLTPSGPARQARRSTPSALVRAGHHYLRTQPMAGFLHFCSRTLHRTAFDYSPPAAHPFGAGATSAPFNAFGVSPSRAPLFKEPSLWLGFCISAAGLSIELRSIIRRQRLTPSGPARRARRSTPSALVRAGHHYLKNPPKRRVFAFLQSDSPSN